MHGTKKRDWVKKAEPGFKTAESMRNLRAIWSYVSSIAKEVLIAEMNKEEEEEKCHKQTSISEHSKGHSQRQRRCCGDRDALSLILTCMVREFFGTGFHLGK